MITGGAGFIGSHVADELLAHGYRVRVLDSLSPQTHGSLAETGTPPDYLARDVEFQRGDIRDPAAVRRALVGVDAVYHLAALVGVGQSMYEIERYTSVNSVGTAVLLEALVERPVERLIVASSMSIYGEGLYRRPEGQVVTAPERSEEQLRAHDWEVRDTDGSPLSPVPTPESKTPALSSIYALTKYDQERMCLTVGRAYNLPTVALRFFNVYGTRQALSNPYTGVLAIFGSRFLNGRRPLVNEDGHQSRDFVSVQDVAQACRLSLEVPDAAHRAFNVGSGHSVSILALAQRMAEVLGLEHLAPEVTGNCRAGDIRHCFPDISLAREVLGYEPRVGLEDGLSALAAWLETQAAEDRVEEARAELVARGLTR